MQTFIYLLIGLLIGLLLRNMFTIREGAGPMVGSIMFPAAYTGTTNVKHKPIKITEKTDVKGLVKTEITEKKDQRVSKDVKGEHWHESKTDVDVKKDVDVVHRYPEIWNAASLRDCNNKKKIIFDNYNSINRLRRELRNLTTWYNQSEPSIEATKQNININLNNIKKSAEIVKRASIDFVNLE